MPDSKQILIVDRAAASLSARLTDAGFSCETNLNTSYDDFLQRADDLYGLVIRSRFRVDRQLIDSKPHLRFIARLGSGVENIDTEYAESKGIVCISTPEGNARAVAEHALGLLLSALRNIARADREVRNGLWKREANKGTELGSQTVGIVGYGHTGPAFADLLQHFGTRILVYDKFKQVASTPFIHPVSLDVLLQQSDVVSLHINYMNENKYFVNEDFLQRMNPGAILLNTSRGNVVDTASVVRHLQMKRLRYACLDVLEYESVNLKNQPLEEWQPAMRQLAACENVILTPHIAGQTLEAEQRHADFAFQKIIAISK